jgi:hypothetical protein
VDDLVRSALVFVSYGPPSNGDVDLVEAPFESRIALLSRIANGYPFAMMLRVVLIFAVMLYALLAAWFYFRLVSAPCATVCFFDLRGVFLIPLPFVGAASTLLAAGMVISRRISH